jgi:hypothetical protein
MNKKTKIKHNDTVCYVPLKVTQRISGLKVTEILVWIWLNLQKVRETSTNISENMQNKGVFTIRLFNDAAFLHILHNLTLHGKVVMHSKNSD